MGWKTRGRLYVVFAVGGGSVIGSIFRQIQQAKLKSDVTWSFKALEDWTLVDLTLGVIAASLPVLSAIIPPNGNLSIHSLRHHMRSKFQGKNDKEAGNNRCTEGTNGGTFGESEENIVRTDVIELSFQSKGDLEQGERMDYREECEGRESGSGRDSGSGSGNGRASRCGNRYGDGSSAGERLKRSCSKNRSRANSNGQVFG
ncbi:hypothetical protein DID88_003619 [Monilinia fructigena]|uniref:Rhodopsin domain-containing protein n=1 Tax=Monilinia fructigena TaxID=38457 RepID=A0A395ITE8_9HELO|nr:hypothetical protein DID88_003619 [Monilinia fructigena]